MNALLERRRRGADPVARLPAATPRWCRCERRHAGPLPCATSRIGLAARPRRHPPQGHAENHARHRRHATRTTRPGRCIRRRCCSRRLSRLARQHQLIVIFADEIYDKTVYDGQVHTSDRESGRRRALRHLQWPVEELPQLRLPGGLDGRLERDKRHARDYIEGLNMLASHAAFAPTRPGRWPSRRRSGATRASRTSWPRAGACASQRDLAHEPAQRRSRVSASSSPRRRCTCSLAWTRRSTRSEDDQQFAYDLLAEEKVLIVQGTGFNWPEQRSFAASCSCPTPTTSPRPSAASTEVLAHYRKRHAA